MSKADKTLEELGFHYEPSYSGDNMYFYSHWGSGVEFYFDANKKTFETDYDIRVNHKFIVAVYKKMKELGWLN